MPFLYYVIFAVSMALPIWVLLYFFLKRREENAAIKELSLMLFDHAGIDENKTLEDMSVMTHGRFTKDQLKDYFLKIKGLQLVDLHTSASHSVRAFLMKPTHVRLNYYEQVQFYSRYLNFHEPKGVSAV